MSELQRAIEQQVSQVLAHHRAEDIAACVRDAGIGNNYGFDGSKRTGGILIESLATTTNTPTIFSNITIADSEFVNNSFGGITRRSGAIRMIGQGRTMVST